MAPAILMLAAAQVTISRDTDDSSTWKSFTVFSSAALIVSLIHVLIIHTQESLIAAQETAAWTFWLSNSKLSAWICVLVQTLGTVIGAFSARYLHGESGQIRFAAAFAGVLGSVQLLLIAGHWVILIVTWAAVGIFLRHLLCFYRNRPFAIIATHKKLIADRLADILLLVAAALAWTEVGSGAFKDLWAHLTLQGSSSLLQLSAVCFVIAVILRTALFPVHGWLIQVMEAPTPVSAMLHAGVVNLGGYLLIQFAPLLEATPAARWLLVIFGLVTAVLAGLVMITRITIKVRLAWSTVAQMGFLLLECGLGLYTLAALHLIGHSLYKAHAFLSASTVVRDTQLKLMRKQCNPNISSLLLAPVWSLAIVTVVLAFINTGAWPWWWSYVIAFAWAPLLWMPATADQNWIVSVKQKCMGAFMVASLTAIMSLAHLLSIGVSDSPFQPAGLTALAGMLVMYVAISILQCYPEKFPACRRWSYGGFFVDEIYTKLAIGLWPSRLRFKDLN